MIVGIFGIVIAAIFLLKQLFPSSTSLPELQLVVLEKNDQIAQLTEEKERLEKENAYLRSMLHWWSLGKEFCVRLAARLLVECVKGWRTFF